MKNVLLTFVLILFSYVSYSQYTFQSSGSAEYTTISGTTGTISVTTFNSSPNKDNGLSFPITLPFTFNYNGKPVADIQVSTNGFIVFDQGASYSGLILNALNTEGPSCLNISILSDPGLLATPGTPGDYSGNDVFPTSNPSLFNNYGPPIEFNAIAILAADLDGTYSNGQIYYKEFDENDDNNDRVIIEWNNWSEKNASGKFSMQMILYKNGKISFLYDQPTLNINPTIPYGIGLMLGCKDNYFGVNDLDYNVSSNNNYGSFINSTSTLSNGGIPFTSDGYLLYEFTPSSSSPSPSPSLSIIAPSATLTSCSGTESNSILFGVDGSNLTESVTISVPSGFEISTNEYGSYSLSVTLTNTTTVTETLYVRLSDLATVGTISVSITATSSSTTATTTVTGTVNASPSVTITEIDASGAGNNDDIICAGGSVTLTASGTTASYLWSTSTSSATITLSPSITTTYTVTGTASGCSNTASITITVNAIPSVNITVIDASGTNNNDAIICDGSSVTLTASGTTASYLWSTSTNSATITSSPSTNTTYTVTGTTSGCSNTASVTVTVNAIPTVNITEIDASGVNPDDAIICEGSSVTLTASGTIDYLWSTTENNSSITPSPSTTTTYTVTGTTSGCSNTASVTITVNTLPSVTITPIDASGVDANDAIICDGSSVTLTASGTTANYTWSTTDNITSITVSPSTNTTYTVTGTTSFGCSNIGSINVTVNAIPTISISETDASGSIPSDNKVCIDGTATLTAIGGNTYEWNTANSSETIYPSLSSNTTYTVTGTTLGCSNTSSITITVESLPSLAFNSITLCNESSYLITNTTSVPNNESWSVSGSGSITFNNGYVTAGTTPGEYTVYYTDGCAQTVSASVTVADNSSLPAITDGQASYKFNNYPQGPLGSGNVIYMGYQGFNYSSTTRPTNTGFYRANNQAGSEAGCPYTFYIFRCTTCSDVPAPPPPPSRPTAPSPRP